MPRALIVDDTASIRFLIRANLELAGYEVSEAIDGIDCLQQLAGADELPDVITLDIMMPRQDGVATAAAVREDPRTAHLGLVMVTTQGTPADISRGMAAGVDAYIAKPFDPDHLVSVVDEVAEKVRQRRSIRLDGDSTATL